MRYGFKVTQWKYSAARLFSGGRHSSSFSHLKEELISRNLPPIFDRSSPTPSRLLYETLHDVFPQLKPDPYNWMRKGYHLIYFPSDSKVSSLFPDGTDPLHSPGPPFTRRMWAGGDVTFHKDLKLFGQKLRCSESISDVEIKGKEGEEKVFVTIRRSINNEDYKREHFLENRILVFMRDRPPAAASSEASIVERDIVKPPHEADHSQTLKLSVGLLLRFSALTFNAHRIHLDQAYCRDVEGHRNLLVHGPLSLVLMLEFLHTCLSDESRKAQEKPGYIHHVEYRCLAPLYAEEELKVCVRRKDIRVWDTWIEGPDGGLAVRGTVTTVAERPHRKRPQAASSTKPSPESKAKGTEEILTTTEEGAQAVSSTKPSPESEAKGVEEISTTAEEGALSADESKPPHASSS
ncbi:MAG: hypothetical protein Q9225_007917 [Loekoesia sp. 1 TL-2023]